MGMRPGGSVNSLSTFSMSVPLDSSAWLRELYWIEMIIGYCVSYDCMNDLVTSRYLCVNWVLFFVVHWELWVLRVSAAGDAAVV